MTRLLALAGMAAMLSGLIVWEAAPSDNTTPEPRPQHRAIEAAIQGTIASNAEAPVASWIATALERPLFREDRRPPKPVLGTIQTEAPTRLVGVITGPFGKRAIFLPPGNGKPIVVSEGAMVSDFQVHTINPGEAIVETEGSTRTLRPALLIDPLPRRP